MKRIVLLIVLSFSISLFAGTGHGHNHDKGHGHSHGRGHSHGGEEKPVKKVTPTKDDIIELAIQRIKVLIFKEKINGSWSKSNLATAEIKTTEKVKEWFLTFENEKGIKGKKLYFYYSLSGEFVAVNFTGK